MPARAASSLACLLGRAHNLRAGLHVQTAAAAKTRQLLSGGRTLHRLHARSLNSEAGSCYKRSAAGPKAGSAAFLPSELPAVVDLFSDYASADGTLTEECLARLLAAVGEPPDPEIISQLFAAADTDNSGGIDLAEFLAAADTLLASNPQVLARCTLVVGGPGSGKGVLCDRLVTECGVGHVSSGDLLREEVKANTPLGQQAAEIMAKGELVPSSMIVAMLRRKMRGKGARRLLLDGFPRSRENAGGFAAECGRPELALHLVCPDEVMIQRILKRAETQGRADDNLETAKRRIAVYHESGAPTLEWLRESRVPIIELDASGTPDDVWSQLLTVGRLMRPAVTANNKALDQAMEAARDKRLRIALRRVDAFDTLSNEELTSLQGAMREVRFGRGDYVFRQGERGDTFYVVVAGRGEAIRVHPDTGERSVLAQLTTGSCFGERALLRDDVRYAGILATAEEGLHAVQITREEFEAILGPLESRVADLYEESEQ
jgi:adenylate kinase family enzyme